MCVLVQALTLGQLMHALDGHDHVGCEVRVRRAVRAAHRRLSDVAAHLCACVPGSGPAVSPYLLRLSRLAFPCACLLACLSACVRVRVRARSFVRAYRLFSTCPPACPPSCKGPSKVNLALSRGAGYKEDGGRVRLRVELERSASMPEFSNAAMAFEKPRVAMSIISQ